MPHRGAVYTIMIIFDSRYGATQRGNAKTIQKAIEDSLTLTYSGDGPSIETLHYSDLEKNNISLNVE